MNKYLFLGVTALALATSATGAVADIEGWANTANREVQRAMPDPTSVDCGKGTVVVSFERSADGRAINGKIVSGADNRKLAEATYTTLRRLHNLPPLPQGVPGNQKLRMVLVFGDGMTSIGRSSYYAAKSAALAKAKSGNAQYAARLAAGEQVATR